MSPKLLKVFKLVALLIGLFIAFILVASFVVDNQISAERSVIIEKPKEDVFEYISHLKNQDNYSVWSARDPDMRQEFYGTDGTVGFISSWEGDDNAGKGEQEIVNIVPGERIDFKLRFYEPFESEADAYFVTESVSENRTKVTWGFASSMQRPMNLMLILMNMEEMIGEDYESGLANLKTILENE